MGGMTRLLLLLWAGVTVGSVVDLQKRILGGHDCLNTERLYHVQLRTHSPSHQFICGGSLISDRWILTAAHCWDLRLYAVVGVHPGPGTGTGPGNRVKVKPHFFWDDQDRIHDIMLLEIINPTPTGIQPVLLPVCNRHITEGTEVQIAGHTITTVHPVTRIKGSVDSDELLCANTNVVSCEDYRRCINTNNPRQWIDTIIEHWLCFQRVDVDVYKGDSGGGVVDAAGRIHGVISLGNDYACAEATASMDVCGYMNWIVATTGIQRP